MTLDDLEYIFKSQIDEGTDKLYFMVIDGAYKEIMRYDVGAMESLVPMLDCFVYNGSEGRMPRFVK